MITRSNLREEAARILPGTMDFSLGTVFQTIRQGKRLILPATLAGAALIAFLIPNSYTSTAQLMPPDQQSIANPPCSMRCPGLGCRLAVEQAA